MIVIIGFLLVVAAFLVPGYMRSSSRKWRILQVIESELAKEIDDIGIFGSRDLTVVVPKLAKAGLNYGLFPSEWAYVFCHAVRMKEAEANSKLPRFSDFCSDQRMESLILEERARLILKSNAAANTQRKSVNVTSFRIDQELEDEVEAIAEKKRNKRAFSSEE